MPVSHLGLTVSHIASASSFYSAALQPLGYRFLGHQGNSIGFGVDSADFFLTQATTCARPSPNHIAFLAEDRNVVRDCYTAALKAGGLSSGTPNYRNEDCSCFNAAVEDLDGNTIEFIYRQPHGESENCGEAAPADSQLIKWQQDVTENDLPEDARSAVSSTAQSSRSQEPQGASISKAKSRMATALDFAKSVKSGAPSLGLSSANTALANSSFPSKTIIGTALGAVAGAALVFAMTREESNNAKEEAEHIRAMASRSKSIPKHPFDESRPMPPSGRAETIPTTIAVRSQVPEPEAGVLDSEQLRHNYSTTESAYSRPYPRSTQAMRMIEATGHNEDDDVQEVMSRYTNLRPHPTRSRTIDAIDENSPDHVPRSESGRSSKVIKRASTLPIDSADGRLEYSIEAARSTTSRHSRSRYDDRDDKRSSTSHRSHHRRTADDRDRLKRHDSGVSMHSSRSHRDHRSEASRRSTASTIKPHRRSSAQDNIPLPPPPMGNYAPASAPSRTGSSCYYPAAIELPLSDADSKRHTTRHRDRDGTPSRSCTTAAPPPAQSSKTRHMHEERDSVIQSWEEFEGEDTDDGLGDSKTVLPEDSISCVDLSRPRRRHRHRERERGERSGASHHSSRRSEASQRTERRGERKERKMSVFGLPIRGKEGGGFSFV